MLCGSSGSCTSREADNAPTTIDVDTWLQEVRQTKREDADQWFTWTTMQRSTSLEASQCLYNMLFVLDSLLVLHRRPHVETPPCGHQGLLVCQCLRAHPGAPETPKVTVRPSHRGKTGIAHTARHV